MTKTESDQLLQKIIMPLNAAAGFAHNTSDGIYGVLTERQHEELRLALAAMDVAVNHLRKAFP